LIQPSASSAAAAVTQAPRTATPAEPDSTGMTKYFVLDTNVLLHNPGALTMFADNHVLIPLTVLEELDKFKKNNDDVGRNCREVIRQLDRLRERGKLSEGVEWNGHGGTIRVVFAKAERPAALPEDVPDNRIISVAWALQQEGKPAVMISKDINVRLKADALGVPAEDFEAQKVDSDRLYRGYRDLEASSAVINQMYDEKQLAMDELLADVAAAEALAPTDAADGVLPEAPLVIEPNEFVQLRGRDDTSHTALARRLADTEHLIPVHAPRRPTYGVVPRNLQQTMAIDLLLDDEIKLVSLLGTAGTGKTLLAIAAGMQKVFGDQTYDKLLVARPIMPMGRDIGYLPGDKDEKLSAWMQPIFDNLEYLLSSRGVGGQQADSRPAEQRIQTLMAGGQLVLEPLTYIRGRSIPNQFMIVDEAQNLTPHEVKTIVSRVGEGTKIVLTGDAAQIDNPYLDASSNGMSYLIERMRPAGQVGHVTLAKSERSELASLAVDLL